MSKSYSGVSAARDLLVSGGEISRLEAIVLFGVPDLTKIISDLRREGFKVESGEISYLAACTRMKRHATLIPPAALPVREIRLTQYWISR